MVSFKDVSFEYQYVNQSAISVLNQLTLEIREGEYVAMMGRNGSGKSTLAKCFNGLLHPTAGSVSIDESDTSNSAELSTIRRKVGIVFQNPDNQIVSTTVEREVAFGLENIGVDYKTMHSVVPAVLERFHLQQYSNHPPHLLSGGEKQRLALAAVMAMNPKYLILDEPTSMLDPASRRELLDIVREIKLANINKRTSEQISIVLITQFPEEALEADRLIILEQGRIMFDDSPRVVFQNVSQLTEIGLQVPIEFEIGQLLAERGKSIDSIWDF